MQPNQYNRPVTEEEQDEIRRLHAEGCGRNEIARRIGRGPRSVSEFAARMGLTFDRTATEAATKARMADLAERRAILAEALHSDAERLTEQLWQPAIVFNIGGKDNTFTKEDVDEPPADAKKNLMAAAGMAIDRSLRLVPPTDDSGEGAARGLIGDLITGLTAVHRARQEQREDAADEGAGDAP